jgi:hypothetical protein
MYKRQPLKGLDFYEQTVTKSDKYRHIGGKLDTGLTVDKVKFISATECVKRRSEIFFRISRRQLFELFDEYEVDDEDPPEVVEETEIEEKPHKPYLILDVREADAYRVVISDKPAPSPILQ